MKQLALILLFFFTNKLLADEAYHYKVDLTKLSNDKLLVELTPPNDTKENEIDFCFPAMVPGTYVVYNFGRFVSDFKVIGKNGAIIKIKKTDINTYRLSPTAQIEKITYLVDDTFDKCDLPGTKEKIVFEPAGTNFEAGKNFALNTHGLFGYIKGYSKRLFILEFEKPKGFYAASGLSDISASEKTDLIKVFDYHDLVDGPLMFFRPDTATIQLGDSKILVACYSPNKKISASFIASTLNELLQAQEQYLGGELPVKKYAFLFYFSDKAPLSGSNGALEHSYSSFYVMPEIDSTLLQQQIRDIAAHEFFHIVTPLNIHSKEIGDFDFNDPKMSEHLWLYEGMTEYAAHHAQLKAGLIDINQFMNVMMQKYETSLDEFNDTMSFTYMSKHVLEEKVHTQYNNVYEKGAVIGMCLDILLRNESHGKYGTQNLMKDLAKKYGKNTSFDDHELFNDIENLTSAAIGKFLRDYVGGTKPLPMAEVFDKIGIEFVKENVVYEFSLGNPDLSFNQKTERLKVEGTKDLDEFGKALAYKKGDEFYKLNGKIIKVALLKETIASYYSELKEGDLVTVDVYRPKFRKGHYKQIKLSARARKIKMTRKNQISLMKEINDQQKQTFRTWSGL